MASNSSSGSSFARGISRADDVVARDGAAVSSSNALTFGMLKTIASEFRVSIMSCSLSLVFTAKVPEAGVLVDQKNEKQNP